MQNKYTTIRTALQKLLKPLIRILLRYGYSYREFNSLAKQLFVDVCYEDFAIDGRKMTASRVSVLTGLDRKEIVKLVNQRENQTQPVKQAINRASRVIGGWLQDADYHNKKGEPLTLSVKGDGISFASLVRKYGGDITAGPILDELLRIEAVRVVEETKVELLAEGYVPVSDELEKLKILGDCTRDLLTTINYNLDSPKHPRYQREVLYRGLSQNSVNEFKLVSHDKCHNLLLDLNTWLANKLDLDTRLETSQPESRVGIGIYYIEDVVTKADPPQNS
ncbi:MAG: DUF6502 family protein [Thiohalomonadales bacterium]